MSEFKFPASKVTGANGVATVTAFNFQAAEPVHVADETHPAWDEIIEGLKAGDPEVWTLFNVADGMIRKFRQVTDRVSWDGANVLWDGDPIHTVLADQLSRALQGGKSEDYIALAKFWEKLESNPDEHSRTQAYDWLACHKFQITPEGDIVGYKYVTDLGNGKYQSGRRSEKAGVPSAFVNGTAVPPLSHVPQEVGDVVTMPRSEVAHDPREACKRGLHVGTFEYVGGGNGRATILEVHVNPRDVVSVPTDANGAKVRVCRYTVARLATEGEVGTAAVLRRENQPVWAGDVGYRVA